MVCVFHLVEFFRPLSSILGASTEYSEGGSLFFKNYYTLVEPASRAEQRERG